MSVYRMIQKSSSNVGGYQEEEDEYEYGKTELMRFIYLDRSHIFVCLLTTRAHTPFGLRGPVLVIS